MIPGFDHSPPLRPFRPCVAAAAPPPSASRSARASFRRRKRSRRRTSPAGAIPGDSWGPTNHGDPMGIPMIESGITRKTWSGARWTTSNVEKFIQSSELTSWLRVVLKFSRTWGKLVQNDITSPVFHPPSQSSKYLTAEPWLKRSYSADICVASGCWCRSGDRNIMQHSFAWLCMTRLAWVKLGLALFFCPYESCLAYVW